MTKMRTPIFIDNNGDISVFTSVQDAENWIEPIDVLNSEYEAFDSDGRSLVLAVNKQQGFSSLVQEIVQISLAETEPNHAEELRQRLRRFLSAAEGRDFPPDASLSQLVNSALRFAIK